MEVRRTVSPGKEVVDTRRLVSRTEILKTREVYNNGERLVIVTQYFSKQESPEQRKRNEAKWVKVRIVTAG